MNEGSVLGWVAILGGVAQLVWVAWQIATRHLRHGDSWTRADSPGHPPVLVYAVSAFVSLWCIGLGGWWAGLWP